MGRDNITTPTIPTYADLTDVPPFPNLQVSGVTANLTVPDIPCLVIGDDQATNRGTVGVNAGRKQKVVVGSTYSYNDANNISVLGNSFGAAVLVASALDYPSADGQTTIQTSGLGSMMVGQFQGYHGSPDVATFDLTGDGSLAVCRIETPGDDDVDMTLGNNATVYALSGAFRSFEPVSVNGGNFWGFDGDFDECVHASPQAAGIFMQVSDSANARVYYDGFDPHVGILALKAAASATAGGDVNIWHSKPRGQVSILNFQPVGAYSIDWTCGPGVNPDENLIQNIKAEGRVADQVLTSYGVANVWNLHMRAGDFESTAFCTGNMVSARCGTGTTTGNIFINGTGCILAARVEGGYEARIGSTSSPTSGNAAKGSMLIAYSTAADVRASKNNCFQFGVGTNDIADCLQVGQGVRIHAVNSASPTGVDNGSIWLDGTALMARTSGTTGEIQVA